MIARRSGCLLLETDSGWRLLGTAAGSPPDLVVEADSTDELVDAVEEFVETHRLHRRRLLVAVHSNSTMFASFPTGGSVRLGARNTLTFQLEASLPCDAEDVVADFAAGKGFVGGVAVRHEELLPLIVALEARGLLVQSVVPAAVLACQALLRSDAQLNDGMILRQDGDVCEFFQTASGQIKQWRHLSADSATIAGALKVASLDVPEPQKLTCVDLEDDLAESLTVGRPECRRITTDGIAESTRRAAAQVLSGSSTPWFELRRDQLANGDPHRAVRKNVAGLLGAVAALLIGASVAWWWQASQLQQRFAEIAEQQREAFQSAFPESRTPRAVVSRLQSEHVKVIRSRELTDEVPASQSALEILHQFLSSQPTGLRYRTTEIWIEEGVVTADVELRSHDDAAVLAASLEQGGFVVDPPTTTQRDKETVVTQLRARRAVRLEEAVADSSDRSGEAI